MTAPVLSPFERRICFSSTQTIPKIIDLPLQISTVFSPNPPPLKVTLHILAQLLQAVSCFRTLVGVKADRDFRPKTVWQGSVLDDHYWDQCFSPA